MKALNRLIKTMRLLPTAIKYTWIIAGLPKTTTVDLQALESPVTK